MKSARLCFFLGAAAIILSLLPFAVNLAIPVTPGRVNPYWDNWPYDFNYYRSIITQGKNGRLTTLDKYTSENQTGKFLRVGYLGLGHLARIFHLDETTAYHLARILLGIIFVYLIYRLTVVCLFPIKPWLIPVAFFIALFVPGIPEISCQTDCRLVPRLWSLTYLDPLRRLTFIPHFLWGQIAFILILLLLLDQKKRLLLFLAGAGLFLGVTGLVHPPSLTFIYPLLALTVLSLFWKKNLTAEFIRKILLVTIFSLPGLIYLFSATASFPWNLTRQDLISLNANFIYFLLAMGPAFIIGTVAAIIIFLSKKQLPLSLIILSCWLLAISLLTFVKPNSFYSQTSFIQVAPQIPAAVLSVYAGFIIYRKLRCYLNRKKTIIVGLTAALVIFLPTLPTLYLLYYDQFDYVIYFAKYSLPNIPYPPIIDYPPQDWMTGFYWLKKHSPAEAVVLSDFTAGNFIPTYGGNTVYYGHGSETYRLDEKKRAVIKFFSSDNPGEQKNFLVNNRISYIYFGPQEKKYRQTELVIPGIKVVYKNPLVTIYQFNLPPQYNYSFYQ